MVADSMCAENSTFWDTEGYAIFFQSFHTALVYFVLYATWL